MMSRLLRFIALGALYVIYAAWWCAIWPIARPIPAPICYLLPTVFAVVLSAATVAFVYAVGALWIWAWGKSGD